MFTRILGVAVDAFLGVAGLASGNGDKPTKFTIRVENTTKPDAFTASNGVKWSLAFSPGAALVHTDKAPIFTAGKKDRGNGLEAQSEDGDPSMLAQSRKVARESSLWRSSIHQWARARRDRSLQAPLMS